MDVNLKRVEDQVIVITGATSGIGLVTARMAADRGARLVLFSRNERALDELTHELNRKTDAIYVPGDVANHDDVHRLAGAAVSRFGGFDTWVNNAGVSVYGRLMQIPIEDQRRLFE